MAEKPKSDIRNDMRAFDNQSHMKRARWEEMRRLLGQILTVAIILGIFVALWLGASAIMSRGDEEPEPQKDAIENVNYI